MSKKVEFARVITISRINRVIWDEIEVLRKKDEIPRSRMVEILVGEALAQRRAKK